MSRIASLYCIRQIWDTHHGERSNCTHIWSLEMSHSVAQHLRPDQWRIWYLRGDGFAVCGAAVELGSIPPAPLFCLMRSCEPGLKATIKPFPPWKHGGKSANTSALLNPTLQYLCMLPFKCTRMQIVPIELMRWCRCLTKTHTWICGRSKPLIVGTWCNCKGT